MSRPARRGDLSRYREIAAVLARHGFGWLVAELGLTGSPQMLLRTGYPTGPGSPPSGRRPVSEVSSG